MDTDTVPLESQSRLDTKQLTRDDNQAQAAPQLPTGVAAQTDTADSGIPTVTELGPPTTPRPRTRPMFWLLGIVTLCMIFLGQITFYFRGELAQYRDLKPVVLEFCRLLDCEVEPLRRIGLIELTYATIAPHPQYENILRIRASMVNRADFAQPYPLMEVTLTDSAGRVIGRRTFEHRAYLNAARAAEEFLSPHVAANTLLDVNNPDGKAVGYEVQLVAP